MKKLTPMTRQPDAYPEIKTEQMRAEACRNQDHQPNQDIPELNRQDREHGPLKGGC